MCGIFGYIGSLQHEHGVTLTRTLAHRGPDGEGFFHTPEVFLGHRRLAILDRTDSSAQPMTAADGRYTITYNGEIYNFLEVRASLEALGHTFRSSGDTEIILTAFKAWGADCVHHFNGMWAFAIWDNVEKQLFLSRDRFGKKPLFYASLGRDFAFGSEMKAIAPLLPAIEPNTTLTSATDQLFYYEYTTGTLIKNVHRFPAGHNGWVKNGVLTTKRYWHTLDHLVSVPDRYEDQVAQFRELFFDACRIRMRADVPIGTALSGGLDSSAVFGTIAWHSTHGEHPRASRDWQHAFSASFPGTPLDEIEWAEKVATHCGAPLTTVVIDPATHVENFLDELYRFEDLYLTPHIPFFDTYGAMRAAGVVVTLDGHGADELFGGYHFDYLHIIHDELGNPTRVKDVIDTYYRSCLVDGRQFGSLPPKAWFAAKQIGKNAAKHLLRHHNHHPDDQHPAWSTLDYFTQKLYISFHQTVLPTLLRNYDRYSMAHGIEIRMPFMDHRIVSLAFSLPASTKVRDGYTKKIIRDAVADILPHDVVYRTTKVGFNAPMVDWMKGPLRHFFEAALERLPTTSPLANPQTAAALVGRVIENPSASFVEASVAWSALAPFLWEEGFVARVRETKEQLR
jgi:asparagine synthase (glutamine-hydrolysing)